MPCNYPRKYFIFLRQGNIIQFSSFLESILSSLTSFTTVLVCRNSGLNGFVVFILGRYGDYGLRTTAGRALSFVCSTGLSRANIER